MKASVENHREPTTLMKAPFILLLKRHSLIIGTLLMFDYTWTIDLSNSGVIPFKVPFVVGLTEGIVNSTLPLWFHIMNLSEPIIQSFLLATLTHDWVNRPEQRWFSIGKGCCSSSLFCWL